MQKTFSLVGEVKFEEKVRGVRNGSNATPVMVLSPDRDHRNSDNVTRKSYQYVLPSISSNLSIDSGLVALRLGSFRHLLHDRTRLKIALVSSSHHKSFITSE